MIRRAVYRVGEPRVRKLGVSVVNGKLQFISDRA